VTHFPAARLVFMSFSQVSDLQARFEEVASMMDDLNRKEAGLEALRRQAEELRESLGMEIFTESEEEIRAMRTEFLASFGRRQEQLTSILQQRDAAIATLDQICEDLHVAKEEEFSLSQEAAALHERTQARNAMMAKIARMQRLAVDVTADPEAVRQAFEDALRGAREERRRELDGLRVRFREADAERSSAIEGTRRKEVEVETQLSGAEAEFRRVASRLAAKKAEVCSVVDICVFSVMGFMDSYCMRQLALFPSSWIVLARRAWARLQKSSNVSCRKQTTPSSGAPWPSASRKPASANPVLSRMSVLCSR
jgi:chromosome segregation ATPase